MDWVEHEFGCVDIGDKRLNKRAKTILRRFIATPTSSIPESCKGWQETKAAYRFFENDLVTAKKVIKPHRVATLNRIKSHPTVLLLQDTTALNYSGQKEREDLGPLQQDNVRGIFLHPMLAMTPQRECLGIVDYEQWSREPLANRSAKERKAERCSKGIKEKESYRWVRGYKKASRLAKFMPDTQFVYIADREGDIYDIYHEAQTAFSKGAADWVIRATFDRPILTEEPPPKSNKLKASVKATPGVGTVTFTTASFGNRKKREITQAIYAKEVTLLPPRKKAKEGFSPVKVTAIIATETNPLPGEKAVEWTLLTSIPIPNLEAALQVIEYYLCRWQIEIFFKILKSGCAIEKLQLSNKERFDPCLAMYLIVAWRILFMTMIGRASPSLSSESLFETLEWQTAYIMIYEKPPPQEPPTLKDMLRMIARLGGFLGRKHDGDPGPVVMWKGLRNLYQYMKAREIFSHAFGHTYG